jgi:hypothetical protein
MIEGTLKIHWDNSGDAPADGRMYKVSFVPEDMPAQDGGGPYKEVLGEESLLDYLIELQPTRVVLDRRVERAKKWVAAVHSEGHLSLENTVLTDEQYQVLSAA